MVAVEGLRNKTYEDYLAPPEGVKAELIDGELYMSPQPKGRHVRVTSLLGAHLARLRPFESIELDIGLLWSE